MTETTNQLKLNLRNVGLEELMQQLAIQRLRMVDLSVSPQKMSMIDGQIAVRGVDLNGNPFLRQQGIKHDGSYFIDPSDIMQGQLAAKYNMNRKYHDWVKSTDPQLYDTIFNRHWRHYEAQRTRQRGFLLRTFLDDNGGGIGRAMVSDSYGIIDNLTILEQALVAAKTAADKGGLKVVADRCNLSEKHMYIRFLLPEYTFKAVSMRGYKNSETGEESNGDVMGGIVIRNSEIGASQFEVTPIVVVGACNNGMLFTKDAYKKRHSGAKLDKGIIKWSDNTMKSNTKLSASMLTDVFKTFFSKDYLGQKVQKVEQAASMELTDPVKVVTNLSENHFQLSDDEKHSVLSYFLTQGTNNSALDMVQPFTFLAQKVDNADRQYEMEQIAGGLVNNLSWAREFQTH